MKTLTHTDVMDLLLQRRLVTKRDILYGHLKITSTGRRNNNYTVVRDRDRCYFVKQGLGTDMLDTIQNEAQIYKFLSCVIGEDALSSLIPQYYFYDPEQRVIVFELVQDSQSLQEDYSQTARFSMDAAEALGKALGLLHEVTSRATRLHLYGHNRSYHFGFGLHRPDFTTFLRSSLVNIQLTKIFQQSEELCRQLDDVNSTSLGQALVHGDMRWDNIRVIPKVSRRSMNAVKFVDWEFACIGDPCWDVGTVLNEYLCGWLLSAQITPQTRPYEVYEQAKHRLGRAQFAVRAFWNAYKWQVKLDSATAESWIVRSVRCAAAKMIQTMYEKAQYSSNLTAESIYLLQLSLNVLKNPEEACVGLLGISPDGQNYERIPH